MHWENLAGGTALFLNGHLIGWVTSTMNGSYFFGFRNQTTSKKEKASTKHEAMMGLIAAIGD